jgi:hypothetical protein
MARNEKNEESCGKEENQKQVSHFPTAIPFLTNRTEVGRAAPPPYTAALRACRVQSQR